MLPFDSIRPTPISAPRYFLCIELLISVLTLPELGHITHRSLLLTACVFLCSCLFFIASEAKRRKARRVEGAIEESSFYGHIWDLKTRR